LPTVLGLTAALALGKRLRPIYLLAFSTGIIVWVFVDVINGAGNLDVSASFSGGLEQVAIVVLFAVGLVAFSSLDGSIFPSKLTSGSSLALPLLLSIAIGLHGLGEGSGFADVSATTPITSLVSAFGGEASGAAYVAHKFLESLVVGVGYPAFSSGRPTGISARAKDAAPLALGFILPSVVAMGTGYFVAYNSSYFYALGAGALLYALLKLAGPIFAQPAPGDASPSKIVACVMAGVLCVYLAALLHSYVP